MTSKLGKADFNALSEAEKRVVAERLLAIEQSGWKPFWCPRRACDGMPHIDATGAVDPAWSHNHARADQRLPAWNKKWTLFIMSGRGSGKTRTGVEFVTLCARKGLDGAILGRRGTELVNTHVAEIIKHAHPEFVPIHWASKDILEWPNGAITYLFSAEKPENIRSVNLSYAWVDEAAFMDEIETAWMNLKLATRVKKVGNPVHFLITSTPTGTPWVQKMEDEALDPTSTVELRRVSTYANKANLDPGYLADLEREYEGTRMGRQELHGEVLRDVDGALWNDDMFKHEHAADVNEFLAYVDAMDDRVLAIDPAGSKGKHSDSTGIIGAGVQHFDDAGNRLQASNFTVLCDFTLKGSPSEWAEAAFKAARLMRANRIVAEKNFGGDMVKQVLDDWAKLNPSLACDEDGESFKIEVVRAQAAKEVRAEGTVGKYEQGRVVHLATAGMEGGDLSQLEKEQVLWVPKSRGGRMPSPNRIDATVWAVRALEAKVRFDASVTTSREVMAQMVKPVSGNIPVVPTPTTAPVVAAKPRVIPGPKGQVKRDFPMASVKEVTPVAAPPRKKLGARVHHTKVRKHA